MLEPITCGPSYKPMETQSPREKLPELFHHLHRPLSWLVSPSQSEKSLSSCKKVLEAPHLLSHQLYQEVQKTLTKHALLRRGFFHSPLLVSNLYIYNFCRIGLSTKYFQVCLALNCVKAIETLAMAARKQQLKLPSLQDQTVLEATHLIYHQFCTSTCDHRRSTLPGQSLEVMNANKLVFRFFLMSLNNTYSLLNCRFGSAMKRITVTGLEEEPRHLQQDPGSCRLPLPGEAPCV